MHTKSGVSGKQCPENNDGQAAFARVSGELRLARSTAEATTGIEGIREELSRLTITRRGVHQRIHSLRRAITVLVDVFGPEILIEEMQQCSIQPHNVSYRGEQMIDVCREALKGAAQWLTAAQILSKVKTQAPLMIARFRNPSVSLSNALRTLRRRAEIESVGTGARTQWRWIPQDSNVPTFDNEEFDYPATSWARIPQGSEHELLRESRKP
jgi:hypothetical protein